eukprot:gene2982-4992_t
MFNLNKQVQKLLKSGASKAFPNLPLETFTSQIKKCQKPELGDLESNLAIKLYNLTKKSSNATIEEMATKIVSNIDNTDLIDSVNISKDFGNLNINLSTKFLSKQLESYEILWKKNPKEKVVIDFSSPNIAKSMHVGHLRSTIIGECISRILEFCNYDVLRINHIGDWGTQFGMLIEMIKSKNLNVDSLTISELENLYKKSKEEFDKDEIFKRNAQKQVVELQSGNPESLYFWKKICEISQKEYQKIYDELNIKLIDRGESFYNPMLNEVIDEINQKKMLKISQNATIMEIPNSKTPLMVKKSDGGFTYDTTDLATLKHRIFKEKANWLIYVVDKGQQLHFDLVFRAGKLMEWVNYNHKINHVPFGVVLGEDGKKFKTRSGESVKLNDLLEESKRKAIETLKGRDNNFERNEKDFKKDASVIAISAIKYADLKNNLKNNYTFSYNKMLDYRGNTAVYLIYAYARLCSILRKSSFNEDFKTESINITHQSEKNLIIHILKFGETIENVLTKLQPHLLCEYLYELSLLFTSFHRDCRVIGDKNESSRLRICYVTKITMKKCFDLLGMETLEKL